MRRESGGIVSAKEGVVSLRTVADRVGLAPCSVSAILNRTPAAQAIPKHTQDRVFRAALELNYQPNLSARSLRTKRTHMVALLSKDFARPDVGHLVSRIERMLWERGYLLVLGSLQRLEEWPRLSVLLRQRGVEGLIAVGIEAPRGLTMPAISVHVGNGTHSGLNESSSSALSKLAESAVSALLTDIEGGTQGKTRMFAMSASSYLPPMDFRSGAAAELG